MPIPTIDGLKIIDFYFRYCRYFINHGLLISQHWIIIVPIVNLAIDSIIIPAIVLLRSRDVRQLRNC